MNPSRLAVLLLFCSAACTTYTVRKSALAPHMQDFVDCYSYPHLERPGIRIVDCDHGKFMNHNERPNTDFTVFDRGYALVDIQKGEEITCNYFEFDPSFAGFGHASTAEALSERPHTNR